MTPLDTFLIGMKAAADPSRLRLLAICAHGEWTVSELVQILGQSQPRISRHLKLLAEAGLLERFREGSWVFYRRAHSGPGSRLAKALSRHLPDDDPQLLLDRQRLATARDARRAAAERYFDDRADGWDSERDLAVDGGLIEQALTQLAQEIRPAALVDIGTGTGRILRVLSRHIGSGLGIDSSHDMLKVARAHLDRRETRHCQVRHGDMYQLPLQDQSFEAAILHQVLHFADDPLAVLTEARRVLKQDGRIIVCDLLQHDEEWLREEKRHRRLGFSPEEMSAWFSELGFIEEEPLRFEGDRLTVVIWQARLGRARQDDTSAELLTREAA
ncbi:transcriptional regulator, ArsR family [Arboricoccus pini]|uniref:Transcriptional regulator, ArsR family n=1 Tax=Arboricoccus pini TaxID=1963835 RepID=A0A212QMK3_9PROT|nr:metalloregulator ArsR/SmtB family transcription factor [Arboricoccus pini]SNB60612.1 transcriptional regulator, ArsR family [Arboricoccus pini]